MNFDNNELKVMTADNGVDGAPGTPVTGKIVVTPQGDLAEGVVDTKNRFDCDYDRLNFMCKAGTMGDCLAP